MVESGARPYSPGIVRPNRVVAGTALMVLLALVAVPASVGSRTPSPIPRLDPAAFRSVSVHGRPIGMVSLSPDPRWQSAARVGETSPLVEPVRVDAPGSRPARSQPAAPVRSIRKNPWHHDQEASFYGPGFYGRRTACGYALTTSLRGVAHRTLPCGTLVTFRNPANGRIATVPVVDRGPYVSGRMWDLTGGLCEYLGHCYTGPIDWKLASSD